MCSNHFPLDFQVSPWKPSRPSLVGGLPLGKFRVLHFVVLVLTAFSSSLRPPEARIAVWTVFPQVCDFLPESWSSSGFLFWFHEKIVLPLGMSQRNSGMCLSMSWSSESWTVLPCSALESVTSFRGSPRWALILMRKVLTPAVTRSWRIRTISLSRSSSGVVARFSRVPSPVHFLMVFRRVSLSVR